MDISKIIHDSKKLKDKLLIYNESELIYLLEDYNLDLILKIYQDDYNLTDDEFNKLAVNLKNIKSSRYIEILILMKYSNINVEEQLKNDIDQIELHETKLKTFILYDCLNMVKFLINNEDNEENMNDLFNLSCDLGFLEMTKYLYSLLEIHDDYSKLFIRMCEFNHLNIAKWLYYDIRINSSGDNDAFVVACLHGDYEMIEWLISTGVNIYHKDGEGITNAYINGHCEATDLLYEMHGSTSFFRKDNNFELICKKGYLEMVKYVLDKDENDIITMESFLCACENNHLEIAKILYFEGDLDIYENYSVNLNRLCKHQNIFTWISSL